MGLLDELLMAETRKRNLMMQGTSPRVGGQLTQMVARPSQVPLREQFPTVYGALGGLLGMEPDSMEGSILDPNTAAVRQGAGYGYPAGLALQALPMAAPAVSGAKAVGKFVAPKAGQLAENYMQSMGMMPGIVSKEGGGLLGDVAAVAKVPNINEAEVSGLLSPAMPIKPMAEVSPLGFYSAVEQQALNIPRKSGTGASFINDLMKGQDVKKYEIEAMGLDEFLQGKPNITRQEVQDFIAGNRIDVQEKMLGGNQAPSQDLLSWMNSRNIMTPRNPEGWQELSQKLESYAQQHQKAQGAPEASQRYFTLSEEAGRISEGLDAGGSAAGATKYDKYQLPGGENYREILLTTPIQGKAELDVAQQAAGDLRRQTADLMNQWKAGKSVV